MKLFLILMAALSLSISTNAIAQDGYEEEYENELEETEPTGKLMGVNADLGYFGPAGLSLGAGFRYWFAGFTLGISGLMNDIPNYSTYGYDEGIYANSPLPPNYDGKSYPALIVTGDFSFHYEVIKKVTAFGSIGFYSQQDTVLAWDFTDDVYYYWKYTKKSGVCFGLGADFDYSDILKVGLGYHTKRGLFARITYFWY